MDKKVAEVDKKVAEVDKNAALGQIFFVILVISEMMIDSKGVFHCVWQLSIGIYSRSFLVKDYHIFHVMRDSKGVFLGAWQISIGIYIESLEVKDYHISLYIRDDDRF